MQINPNKNLNITDRILQYLEYKGISKYKFCKDLGFSNGFLDKSRDIGTNKYANILAYLSGVNPNWLLTGEGDMLKIGDNNIIGSGHNVVKGSGIINNVSLPERGYQKIIKNDGSVEIENEAPDGKCGAELEKINLLEKENEALKARVKEKEQLIEWLKSFIPNPNK